MTMTENLTFTWPIVTDEMRQRVQTQMDESLSIYNRSGVIAELEDKFRHYYGRQFALATNSGTTALWSLYVGAQLSVGDEVICPTYTFFATVTPLFFTGAIPVLVDCDESGNIDPARIREKISPRTRAIMVTHMWGIPCQMDEIARIAEENGLLLFEDVSHAHGARYQGQLVGTFGQAAAFSLQAQKLVTGGEGGILLTDDEEIYYRALLLGHYNKRCRQEIPADHPLHPFAQTGMGMKLRSHPLAAAIASEQFDHLDDWLHCKRRYAQRFNAALTGIPGVVPPQVPEGALPGWYAYTFQVTSMDPADLERLHQRFLDAGCSEVDRPVSTGPLHLLPLFAHPEVFFPVYRDQTLATPAEGECPVSETLYQRLFKVPVWTRPEDEDIVEFYAAALRRILREEIGR